jgi:hypothetical protein
MDSDVGNGAIEQDGAVIVCSLGNVASKKIASFSRSEYSSGMIAGRAHLHFEQQIALVCLV